MTKHTVAEAIFAAVCLIVATFGLTKLIELYTLKASPGMIEAVATEVQT